MLCGDLRTAAGARLGLLNLGVGFIIVVIIAVKERLLKSLEL